jgi:predicted DsbA family dithiol-disulfide isomerase
MIEVEVWSDVVCPFCYIGKRNFEASLKQAGLQNDVTVLYRSFELDPSAEKSQAISIFEALAKKYGRPVEWAKQANVSVEQTGRAAGIDINTSKIIPTNSFDAHRLIHLAHSHGRQSEMVESLFKAYFTDGKDIAKTEVLRKLAAEVSLPTDEVTALFANTAPKDGGSSGPQLKFHDEVRADEMMAQQMGIRGVPLFLFNGEHALSGAQPVETFVEVFKALQQTPSR